jgi:hypothetical protein
MLAPNECAACEVRKEVLKDGGDLEGVGLMVIIGKLSRQVEDYAAKYRGLMGKHTFPVEVNGPASIVMAIETARALGKPVDLDAILADAYQTIDYIKALGEGRRPAWHELRVPK